MAEQGTLLGLGNPLLDISAEVEQQFLDKYDVKVGTACLADPVKHKDLYKDLVENHKVEYIAGGAAQNSIRAASWMLQNPGVVHYIGCIGKDENGKNMNDAAAKYGVTTHYLIDNEKPTGTCAVLIRDKERALIANLAAAEQYKKSHFQSEEIQAVVKNAKFFYTTCFILTHSAETIVELGKHAKENNKPFLLNLAAPFLIDFFWDQVNSVIPYADVIFCNEDEAAALGKKMNWGTDLQEVAKKLADYKKENTSRKRTVIFTQGPKETIVFSDEKVHLYTPILCTQEEIVDTNGAGDAFVGGFLSQYIQGKSLEESVKGGHYAAWECIRRSGATFPDTPNYKP